MRSQACSHGYSHYTAQCCGHGHSHCTVCGVVVTVTVIAPCGCYSHCHHTICGVTVTVIVPHVSHSHSHCTMWVLQLLSLRHVWVMVTVIALCGCCSHDLDYPFSFYLIISDSFSLTDTAEWLLLVFQIIIGSFPF